MLASANVYETFDGGQTAITVIARPVGLGGPARMAYGGRQNGADAPDVAYCAIGNQVWRRQPGEAALTPLASPLEGEAIDISVDPYDWSRVVIIENSRVWRSDQAGDTWAECTATCPAWPPTSWATSTSTTWSSCGRPRRQRARWSSSAPIGPVPDGNRRRRRVRAVGEDRQPAGRGGAVDAVPAAAHRTARQRRARRRAAGPGHLGAHRGELYL